MHLLQEQPRLGAEESDHAVDHPVDGQHVAHDAADHHPGDEVRQVADGLERLLPGDLAYLVQEQGEDDRPREADRDLQEADADRVPQHLVELLGVEQALEVGEPDPGAAEQAAGDGVLLEGDDDPGHRDVAKQHEYDQRREQQQQVLAMPVHLLEKRAARASAAPGTLRRDHHLLAHPNSSRRSRNISDPTPDGNSERPWSENGGHRALPHAPFSWSSISRSDRGDSSR